MPDYEALKDNGEDEWLYRGAKKHCKVKIIRTSLQFFIGLVLLGIILLKAFTFISFDFSSSVIGCLSLPLKQYIFNESLLFSVGKALMLSSAVELAYMLFTPGPDEAIDPLILSITASALLVLSRQDLDMLNVAIITLLFSLSLGVLFCLRYFCRKWFPSMKR